MHRFDGENDIEATLWHSLLRLALDSARSTVGVASPGSPAIVDQAKFVWSDKERSALQTILFAAFVLEARLKRVLEQMGEPPRQGDGLDAVLSTFWKKLANQPRIHGGGKCECPEGWEGIKNDLDTLRQLRNKLAHGNLAAVLQKLPRHEVECVALKLYNSVVEAIALVNFATGYEDAPYDTIKAKLTPLRVWSSERPGR